jgi:hypothetical protein
VQKLLSIYERWYYGEIICKKGIENWPLFHEQIFQRYLVQIPCVTCTDSELLSDICGSLEKEYKQKKSVQNLLSFINTCLDKWGWGAHS